MAFKYTEQQITSVANYLDKLDGSTDKDEFDRYGHATASLVAGAWELPEGKSHLDAVINMVKLMMDVRRKRSGLLNHGFLEELRTTARQMLAMVLDEAKLTPAQLAPYLEKSGTKIRDHNKVTQFLNELSEACIRLVSLEKMTEQPVREKMLEILQAEENS